MHCLAAATPADSLLRSRAGSLGGRRRKTPHKPLQLLSFAAAVAAAAAAAPGGSLGAACRQRRARSSLPGG